jgi:heme-degrading monooxygenase HmoA
MWKLKDSAEGGTKEENSRKIKEGLEALKGVIKEIREIEVGINFEKSDADYDLVLYSVFDSEEDLNTYQKHPEHLKVAEFIGKVRENRIVADYRS